MNHSHIKSRSTLKQSNNRSARKQVKVLSLKHQPELNTTKSRKKNAVRQIPSTKIDISSLSTSRDNSTQPSNSQINRSFLLEGHSKLEQNAPTIRIEEECSVEEDLHDITSYIKANEGRQFEIVKQSLIYKSKISKLKKENKELKMKIDVKEAELAKKDRKIEKERRSFKRIEDKIKCFALKFNKALDKLEALCNSQFNPITDASSYLDTPDPLPNSAIDTSVTSGTFYSPKVRDSLKYEIAKAQKSAETMKSTNECSIMVQSSKKNIKLYKEVLKSLKGVPKAS